MYFTLILFQYETTCKNLVEKCCGIVSFTCMFYKIIFKAKESLNNYLFNTTGNSNKLLRYYEIRRSKGFVTDIENYSRFGLKKPIYLNTSL